jgi:hypothetical protein
MRRARSGGALALALAAGAASARAEEALPVGPGVRVRIAVASSRDRLEGTVQALDQRFLSVISDDHQLVQVPRSTITALETGWGRRGNARKGLVIGAMVGAGGGLLACAASAGGDDWPFDDEHDSVCNDGDWVAVPAVAAAVYGGIGALIGHFIKTDRWMAVPLDRFRVSLATPAGGVGLAISLGF